MASGVISCEPRRRVVITGMGVMTPNGTDLATFWTNVCKGRSAATELTRFDPKDSPSRLACEIRNWCPTDYMDAKTAKRLERSHQYGIAASRCAATDAGLDFKFIDPDRAGVVEGTSVSNYDAAYNGRRAVDERGHRTVTPSMMISGYVGSGSAEIANQLHCKGHAVTMSSGSSSGNDVIGYALSMIQNEDVDVMVAGAAEAPLIDTIFFGFAQSHAMSRSTGDPTEAMKPFDQHSDGFVMGEGAAFLVLEELGHALSRDAKIHAEVVSHGRSCEAYHPMAPNPDGTGVVRAIEKALRRGEVDPLSVDYINPHGSANGINDIAETRAIRNVFGKHADRLAVSSIKPVTGHSLAAAGAIEAVATVLAISTREIPPTINLRNPWPECDLDYVVGTSRLYPVRVALCLNSGFGGKTSCLALRAYPG